MKKSLMIFAALAVVVFVACPGTALAEYFTNAQRVIDIDFTNPAADHGSGIDIPGGNLDLSLLTYSAGFWGYSGPDDPVLKDSDRWVYGDRGGGSQNLVYVAGEGLVVDDPVGGYLRANGYLVVKIDNWDSPNNYKDFYVHWTAEVSGTPSLSPGVYTYFWGDDYDATGKLLQGGTLLDSGGDRWTDGWELWRIEPNPEFEAWGVNFQFSDATVALKSLHIETRCIPEPSSVVAIIGLLGTGGALWWRRRRRGATRAPWSDENRQAIHHMIDHGRTGA